MKEGRRVARLSVAIAAVAIVISACSTAPAVPAGSSALSASPPAAATATTAPTPAASASAAATPVPPSPAPSTKAMAAVDLVFTGPIAVTAKGSAGQCSLGKDPASGTVNAFNFGATESDYAGLGDGFYVSQGPGAPDVEIKWLAGPNAAFLGSSIMNVVSADHHSVQLDTDIQSGNMGTEHVTGTISCP